MLRTLLRMKEPFYIARQEQAPLLREREAFLEHLLRQGTSLAAARSVSWQLVNVIKLLRLTSLRDVWIDEIEKAAQRWARQQRANPLAHSYKTSTVYFIYVAKKWLRFAGVLKQPAIPRMRFANEFDDFSKWVTEERGLSASTVRSHRRKISLFLKWFSERHCSFAALRLRDVDDFLIFKGANGWSRKSACGYANSLRAFFYYAEQRGCCKPGIAEGIISPRLYAHEGLPEGPQWKQVQQLLKGVKGNSTAALRAKAVLLLLTVYGLRSGEISRLLLSDFDWRLETFTVNHSKRGGIQKYPLQREVGDAILEYIRKARPQTSCRNLCLTLNPPYRSIGHSSLWRITSLRIDAAGIQCRRRGPHCLRHACATHLLEQGASLKEIGDLLGHRDSNSTRIYAKVHLQQLRRVADFDLGGPAMNLAAAVERYVLHKRTTGQKFEGPAVALRAFCRRYGKRCLQAITSTEVKQFLDVPQTGPAAWRRKYGVLRNFFEYWRCREKLDTVPMPLAAPKYTQTFVPFIYSRRELRLLLDAVPRCQRHAACRTSAITLRTLLLFLYGTGMRVGEALRLRLADVDLDYGVITIRGTKFYKSRLVPLGSDVVQVLRKYLAAPGRWNQHYRPFFQSRQHKRLGHSTVDANFRRLCILAGVSRSDASSRQPRLHDLRHYVPFRTMSGAGEPLAG